MEKEIAVQGTRGCLLAVLLILLFTGTAAMAALPPLLDKDPHRNALGFFDMHLCNWPERPPFFKILFSTTKFDQIEKMQVFDPRGRALTLLDKKKFKQWQPKGKPVKRVFLLDLDLPADASDGWYRIEVTDNQGKVHEARDLVPMTRMPMASGMQPVNGAEDISMPQALRWDAVPGAGFYQVFLRDAWTEKLVYQSKLLAQHELLLPPGTLEPGGYYSWVIHARDLNEHILLGDFHNGSLSIKSYFSVTD